MNLPEPFHDRLRRIRRLRKVRQYQLAEQIGVTKQSLSLWECGDSVPTFSNLLALGSALRCSMDLLMIGRGSMRK